MLNHAILVNDDFIVNSRSINIYEGDLSVDCNAIMMVFIKAKQSEIENGTLFASGCIGLNEAAMIIAAKLAKVVLTREPTTSDEMCAVEILRENNIQVIYNPDILL